MLLHRSFVVAACATILSSGMASGQGSAGGSGQGGQAVGVGAPAEQVDGRPPAGRIGGGPPSFNAAPLTSGGVTDSNSGVGNPPGGINSGLADTKPSPPVSGQAQTPVIPPEVRGVAEQAPGKTTGLARPAEDGISTETVKARPCTRAARGTDGTTTCVGIPDRR